MKFYIYTSVILILLGLTLVGCARVEEKAATGPNKKQEEE